jgi:hypothetical protein
MREGSVQEGIARQLVGSEFAGGRFVGYEYRGGKVLMRAKCNQCGGPHSGISVTNAAQAVKNPTVRLINCQHCKYVEPTAAAQTYEVVVRIPESQRTSAQQRLVAEREIADTTQAPIRQRRAAEDAREQAAQAQADRTARRAMFESHERFLTALAHIECVPSINHPNVLAREDYVSFGQWQFLSDEVRAETNKWVDIYFQNNGLRWPC